MDVLERARQFATGQILSQGSFYQRSGLSASQPMHQQNATGNAEELFYKDKYVQGMEERLQLHSLIAEKDDELKEKTTSLEQVLEYIARMEMEIAALDARMVPPSTSSSSSSVYVPIEHDNAQYDNAHYDMPMDVEDVSDMRVDSPRNGTTLPLSLNMHKRLTHSGIREMPPASIIFNRRAWIDLVKNRIPSFSADPLIFVPFVEAFLKRHGLQESLVKSAFADGLKTLGIPTELENIFLDEFTVRWRSTLDGGSRTPLTAASSSESLPLPSKPRPAVPSPSKAGPTKHVVRGTTVFIWIELLPTFMSDDLIQALLKDKAKLKRARTGLMTFLQKRLPPMGLTLAGTKVMKQITIPMALEREFKGWFKEQYDADFQDFSEASSSKTLAKKGPKDGSSSKASKRKNEQAHSQSGRKAQRPRVSLADEDATENVLEEGIAVPSSLMDAAATEAAMTRYNL